MLWWICIAYIIWFECCMVCAFLLPNSSVSVFLMWMTPAEDSGGREWWCENVEWCVHWFPVALDVCGVFLKKHVKWREFSNKVHLNRCLVDITWVNLSNKKTNLIRFTYLGTLGSAGRGLRLNPDWSLYWRTKTEVPTLSVCGLLRHDMG